MTMSYSEIHFHLLPGVDDGPTSVEQSLELVVFVAKLLI